MDLRSDSPYWLLKDGFLHAYPSLKQDITTEVAIIGAGITGALVAHSLTEAGVNVTLLDRRHVGMGSTCASTALLQYEIDTHLCDLIPMVGERHAVRSYQLCLESIDKLADLAQKVGEGSNFQMRKSFYYASTQKDVAKLKAEFEARQQNGLAVKWLKPEEIQEKFSFKAPAGILSEKAAETDAYRLTHALLQSVLQSGGQVYDKTEIKHIAYPQNRVVLTTSEGHRIEAKRLVIAAGYESQQYLKQQVETLNSTYAIVSEPLGKQKFWYENSLIWETARPYLYIRTTADNRLLIGGKDEAFYDPTKRDKLIAQKSKLLQKAFARKFPHLNFTIDFQWAGTFTGTKDGLPYIGATSERPNTYFALGFGGNGITFSQIAAELIRDLYLGKKNRDAEIFSFDRK